MTWRIKSTNGPWTGKFVMQQSIGSFSHNKSWGQATQFDSKAEAEFAWKVRNRYMNDNISTYEAVEFEFGLTSEDLTDLRDLGIIE